MNAKADFAKLVALNLYHFMVRAICMLKGLQTITSARWP